jgi:Bacteriophage clamp loader A subunit
MADLFKDIVPAILQTKKEVLDDEGDYVPFVVNRALSNHFDCILYANEMNKYPHLDKRMQYDYLMGTVRAYKRPFQKWHKRETSENLDAIKEYFNYSNEKAKEALSILSNDQVTEIRTKLDRGGIQKG